ncbi:MULTISPECIES: hypothetical protein [Halobacteriovorax]|uniref:Imelysin-like domain-containing protein n=1 Tax=Halobacteriovorax vibrionivorans TaxID=2152716 RepID=A0ABY0IIB6_9BACT|nr:MULTISPECIES: hypothetical protein [Halobacteriovorax]AYF45123.1 hypothetical protein BALOs_2125 [Halobacteriovorax sp. BALOs_7]RZF22219.1 hypothetical protein DAY19_00185 [Halobacteriovorax vibrionivorans]TGD48471.1 hypothetical protein EP118_03100 [Halobacteriovorax sp. Y22]
MKKRILLFFIILVAMSVSYFLYHFYQDDYLPQKVRGHYESEGQKELKPFSNNTPKKKFVPRKQFHEDNEYKRSDDQVVTIEGLPAGELAQLGGEIQKLEMLNLDCEKSINSNLPPSQIIDPINSSYFQNPDEVIMNLKRAVTFYNDVKARQEALRFVERAEYALSSYEQVSATDFGKILRAPLVCRQSNLTIFFESIIELAEEGEFTAIQKENIVGFMTTEIFKSLSNDYLQDNILMHLTLLKGVGLLSGADQSYFTELESIYDELRAVYSSVYEAPETDNLKVVNPGDVYMEYQARQKQSAARSLELIDNYLDIYLQF